SAAPHQMASLPCPPPGLDDAEIFSRHVRMIPAGLELLAPASCLHRCAPHVSVLHRVGHYPGDQIWHGRSERTCHPTGASRWGPGIAVIDEPRAAARHLPCLYVARPIANHGACRKIDVPITRCRQQEPRLGLAAVAAVDVIVRTHVDSVEIEPVP